MVNLQDLFVIDIEVDVEDDPEPKQGNHFEKVVQTVASRELGGTALGHGGLSGMEKATRENRFERRRRRRRRRRWLTWE